MFEDALRYPTRGDDALTKVAIGGILGLLGFLIVPVILVFGYLVRVIRDVSAGVDDAPPPFDEWEQLFFDGLKATVITLVYTTVPALILAIALAPVILVFGISVDGSGGGVPGIVSALILLIVFAVGILAFLALLATTYVVPVAVTAFARTGRLGAAFSVRELRRIGWRSEFAIGWLIAAVITVLVGFAEGVLVATILGALLVPFLNFYGNVAGAYAIGAGASESPVEQPDPEI